MMKKYFSWKGLNFDISNHNVYPPKPASLLLAETAIKNVKSGEKMLDVCTGCGIVAIAAAKFVPNIYVVASDINPESIKVAQDNASRNKVMIKTRLGDLFEPFDDASFDVITMHPPAIPYSQKNNFSMPEGIYLATNGGKDGSEIIRRAIDEAKRCLKKNGRLLMLLPHWSNFNRSYSLLRKNYRNVSLLAQKKVRFWLLDYSDKEVMTYAYNLAKRGIIEIKFKNNRPFSVVSVICASDQCADVNQ